MKVLGVDNILLSVGDLADARRFYADGLGLPIKFEFADVGIMGFAIGDEEPGLIVRAASASPAAAIPSPRVWLEVADARTSAVELKSRGLTPLAESFEVFTGWTVEYSDPWGNVVGLTDYAKQPSRARSQRIVE